MTSVRELDSQKTMATKVRFEVEFDRQPDGWGTTFCAKFFDVDPDAPGNVSVGSRAEAHFYNEVAPMSKIRAARARYASANDPDGYGIVVMDDIVSEGGRFLTALEPYSPDQAAASLDQLARLHSEHWEGAGLERHPWLRNRITDMAADPLVPTAVVQDLLDGERGIALPPAIRDAERAHRALRAVAALDVTRAPTLVHGDAHAGNVFAIGDEIGIVDWQLLQRCNWAADISYHIGAVLSVESRRASDKDLIAHYLARLTAYGVDAPGFEETFDAYRDYLAYGYYLWAVTRRVKPEITNEFVKRLGTAVIDLGTFEHLGV